MRVVDWERLFDGHASGLETAVHGVRVGDTIAAIPLDRVTEIEPDVHPEGRWSGSRGYFVRTPDGREIPVPREVLVAEFSEHGGRAFIERVCYVVEHRTVRQIWVRGAPLAGLPLVLEPDIERALGPPGGIEQMRGGCVRHYPERSLSVAWANGAVDYIALGPVTWSPPVVRPRDVLGAWLEATMAGVGGDWTEPADRATSRWVRHARLMALLRAYELGSPRDFERGEFLAGKALRDYPRVEALNARDRRGHSSDLPRTFEWLLRYRTDAEQLLQVHSGVLEASGLFAAALALTERTNRTVAAALGEVDALIVELISPVDRCIRLDEMIARWGWPDVDLHDLLLAEAD